MKIHRCFSVAINNVEAKTLGHWLHNFRAYKRYSVCQHERIRYQNLFIERMNEAVGEASANAINILVFFLLRTRDRRQQGGASKDLTENFVETLCKQSKCQTAQAIGVGPDIEDETAVGQNWYNRNISHVYTCCSTEVLVCCPSSSTEVSNRLNGSTRGHALTLRESR